MTETADVGVDLGALAREQALPELRFNWSKDIDKLAAALAKAQGAMRNASKDSSNPYFSSKYADLAAVVDAIRKPLADNGLAVVQPFTTAQRSVTVSTVLMHESGQWMSTEATYPVLPMPKKKSDGPPEPYNPNAPVTPQAYGSATSYLRRYALSSMLGVAADDDDGNAASGNHAESKPSAAEQVRGAVRQATTSPRETKASSKPAPMPAGADPAVAMRFSLLWERAKKSGMKSTEFQDWCAKSLGEKKPSSQYSASEVDHLETAWAGDTAPSKPSPETLDLGPGAEG